MTGMQFMKQIRNIFTSLLVQYDTFRDNLKNQSQPGAHKDNVTRWCYLFSHGKIRHLWRAYVRPLFNWGKLDHDVIRALSNTIPDNYEGCLLDQPYDLRVRSQVNFIASILEEAHPKRILETGTHKAMFCYIVHLYDDSARIDTFGNLDESRRSVDVLNKRYGEYIRYHLGDSRNTLAQFSPAYPVDFAWIDGGHSYEVCKSDLFHCDRLQIPHIAIDDYKWIEEVKRAVHDFVGEGRYSLVSISDVLDYRGIAYLRRG
jgi:hypothetical protein